MHVAVRSSKQTWWNAISYRYKLNLYRNTMEHKLDTLTPPQIVKQLDEYIIGQQEAKKMLAIALRNRIRREKVDQTIMDEIRPHNILMMGPTGSGKTELARQMAKICGVPFVIAEVTQFTERGYVGGDVKNVIRDLAANAYSIVKKSKREAFDKNRAMFEEKVNKVILNCLIPPLTNASNEGDAEHLNEKTREGYLRKIKDGELEDAPIEIEVMDSQPGIGLVSGGAMDEGMMMFTNQIMNKLMAPKKRKRKTTVGEAKRMLLDEAFERSMDMEAIKRKACAKAHKGIVFLDEIDKITSHKSAGDSSPNVSREGVQRDLLTLIEGTTSVKTEIGQIKTDGILFIAAGAFHNSKPSDLMPELQGRLPVRVELNGLKEEDLFQVLCVPRNSLIQQQKALMATEKVKLEFSEDGIRAMAKVAYQLNHEKENIGARRLPAIITQVLKEVSFNTPGEITPGSTVKIDKKFVEERLIPLCEDKERVDYIL